MVTSAQCVFGNVNMFMYIDMHQSHSTPVLENSTPLQFSKWDKTKEEVV